MKKPVIFLSAVSGDFQTLRDVTLRNVLSKFDVEVTVGRNTHNQLSVETTPEKWLSWNYPQADSV